MDSLFPFFPKKEKKSRVNFSQILEHSGGESANSSRVEAPTLK